MSNSRAINNYSNNLREPAVVMTIQIWRQS